MSEKIRQDISIGRNIRALRRKARLTQEEVVAKMDERGLVCSRSIYSQMECGRYNIRVSELVAFSEIFGVDYNAFFQSVEADKAVK